MVFSSLIFLYAFFSLSLLAYRHCRTQKQQNTVLLIFSLIFYAWGEPKYLFLLMFMAFTSWFCALGVERTKSNAGKKFYVALTAVIDISLIGYFKYAGFILQSFNAIAGSNYTWKDIILPLGISFYTFQALSYVIDVRKGKIEPERDFIKLALYISFFPQLVAGPIVRYQTIADQIDLFCQLVEE